MTVNGYGIQSDELIEKLRAPPQDMLEKKNSQSIPEVKNNFSLLYYYQE
jgi:hypothetical protein